MQRIMIIQLHPLLFTLIILAYGTLAKAQDEEEEGLTPQLKCFIRCALLECADKEAAELPHCKQKCELYGRADLCKKEDVLCWSKCKNLADLPSSKEAGDRKQKEAPKNLVATFNPASETGAGVDLKWDAVQGTKLYLIQFKSVSENEWWKPGKELITKEPVLANFLPPKELLCHDLELRAIAVSESGESSRASEVVQLEKPQPIMSAKMKLHSLVLNDTPFVRDEYQANGTLTMALEYAIKKWVFGAEDLEIQPTFHMMTCAVPDLETAIPTPDFYQGSHPNTVEAKLGADMMYRKCK